MKAIVTPTASLSLLYILLVVSLGQAICMEIPTHGMDTDGIDDIAHDWLEIDFATLQNQQTATPLTPQPSPSEVPASDQALPTLAGSSSTAPDTQSIISEMRSPQEMVPVEHSDQSASPREIIMHAHVQSIEQIIAALTHEQSAAVKKHHETVKTIQRDSLSLLMRRATDGNALVSEIRKTYKRNLQGTDIKPKNVYQALNMEPAIGMQTPYTVIKAAITQELNADATANARKKVVRQLAFFFDSRLAKEEYDAYLRDVSTTVPPHTQRQWHNLKKLCLSPENSAKLIAEYDKNVATQLALLDLQENVRTFRNPPPAPDNNDHAQHQLLLPHNHTQPLQKSRNNFSRTWAQFKKLVTHSPQAKPSALTLPTLHNPPSHLRQRLITDKKTNAVAS